MTIKKMQGSLRASIQKRMLTIKNFVFKMANDTYNMVQQKIVPFTINTLKITVSCVPLFLTDTKSRIVAALLMTPYALFSLASIKESTLQEIKDWRVMLNLDLLELRTFKTLIELSAFLCIPHFFSDLKMKGLITVLEGFLLSSKFKGYLSKKHYKFFEFVACNIPIYCFYNYKEFIAYGVSLVYGLIKAKNDFEGMNPELRFKANLYNEICDGNRGKGKRYSFNPLFIPLANEWLNSVNPQNTEEGLRDEGNLLIQFMQENAKRTEEDIAFIQTIRDPRLKGSQVALQAFSKDIIGKILLFSKPNPFQESLKPIVEKCLNQEIKEALVMSAKHFNHPA